MYINVDNYEYKSTYLGFLRILPIFINEKTLSMIEHTLMYYLLQYG